MQRLDYSCGAASLATLMSYYFDDPVSERDVLADVEQLFDPTEQAVIAQGGLSFAELELISQNRGYVSASVSLQASALERLNGPVIVYLRGERYNHFAVFRELSDGMVRLADPSRGNVTMPLDRFLQVWNGETLVLGKDGFGTPAEHRLRAVTHTLDMPRFQDARAPRLSRWIRIPP